MLQLGDAGQRGQLGFTIAVHRAGDQVSRPAPSTTGEVVVQRDFRGAGSDFAETTQAPPMEAIGA